MSFNLQQSLARARRRMAALDGEQARRSSRATRADAGSSRLDPEVRALLDQLCSGYERPKVRELRAQLADGCARLGLRPPSRAALYAWLSRATPPSYRVGELPEHVRALVHNLDDETSIPGAQLVAAIVNNGDTRALSYAAGMPWLCLLRAAGLRDYRPKSRALLEAVLRARGL